MSLKDWVLLLVPTAISLASFFIALATFYRDKPHLRISAQYSVSLRDMPTISVTVNNIGKRPTTIREVGFRPNNITTFELMNGGKSFGAIADIKVLTEPILIDSGAAKEFTLVLDRWPDLVHADTHLLPYAKDASENYHYGGTNVLNTPILRHILDSKGKLPIVPEHLAKRDTYTHQPLSPKDLYPSQRLRRWQLRGKNFIRAALQSPTNDSHGSSIGRRDTESNINTQKAR